MSNGNARHPSLSEKARAFDLLSRIKKDFREGKRNPEKVLGELQKLATPGLLVPKMANTVTFVSGYVLTMATYMCEAIGPEFRTYFKGYKEEVDGQIVMVNELKKDASNEAVISEVGHENIMVSVSHFLQLLDCQRGGYDGPLRTEDGLNFAYTRAPEKDSLVVVYAGWFSHEDAEGWNIAAESLDTATGFERGDRLVSPEYDF